MLTNSFYISLIVRFFDSSIKFIFYLIIPILIGFKSTSEIQLFISLIFITSVFFRYSSEEVMLKFLSNVNFNSYNFNHLLRNNIKILFINYLAFYIFIRVFNFFITDNSENFVFKILNEYEFLIILNSLCVSLISIISFGFRAIGKINIGILIQGSIWPTILFFLIFITYKDNYEFDFVIRYFSLIFSFIVLVISIYFYKSIYFIFKNTKQKKIINKLKYDRLSLYIQSISGLFINWVPIIIYGIFNDSISTGIFATYFKISIGLFYFMLIVDFYAGKEISNAFQLNNKKKIYSRFQFYRKLYVILATIIFLGCICMLYLLNTFFEIFIFDEVFIIFLFLILIASIFGPVDITFLMLNKEKQRSIFSIIFISSILFLFTFSSIIAPLKYSLYIFGILFFLNYFIRYKFIKNQIVL